MELLKKDVRWSEVLSSNALSNYANSENRPFSFANLKYLYVVPLLSGSEASSGFIRKKTVTQSEGGGCPGHAEKLTQTLGIQFSRR